MYCTMYIHIYWTKYVLQLFLKRCTGRHFKVRDDDLSSKQGSLCTFKMILIKAFENILNFIFTCFYICYKIQT